MRKRESGKWAANAEPRQCIGPSDRRQAQQQQVTTILSNPSLRTRVYRHFFNYQHWLDTVADQQEAAGKDASGLRHAFQKLLGFSDAEYQPIQASIDRVATEMTDLQNEVKSNPGERADYAAARDQMIQAEIDTLNSNLSAKDNAAFEARLVQMFVPRQIIQKEVQQ
ncbi:MAG: hypothetical protein ACRD19_03830 [Terriglobia bacterium]